MPGTRKCAGCGCECPFCGHGYSLEYHHEIEELQSRIKEQRLTIKSLESELASVRDSSTEELSKLRDEVGKQKDRYERLYDSHKKQCKLNQLLEHNLITSAEKFIEESDRLRSQVENLTTELTSLRSMLNEAKEESDLYKRECQMAVHLLQTNPAEFRPLSWSELPPVLQDRLAANSSPEELHQLVRRESQPNLYKYMAAASGGLGVTIPSTVMIANVNGAYGDSVNNITTPAISGGANMSNGIRVDRLASLLGQNAASSGLLSSSRLQKFVCTHCGLNQTFATVGTQTTLMPSLSNMEISKSIETSSRPYPLSSTSSRRVGRVMDI